MPLIRIYSYYGSIGAPFPRGLGYSRGIRDLGSKLAALPGVTVHPTQVNWLSQRAFMRDARQHPMALKASVARMERSAIRESLGCCTRISLRFMRATKPAQFSAHSPEEQESRKP